MKIIVRLFTLIMLLNINLNAQAPKFSNDFLNIGVGARGMGMSGAVTASTKDVTAAYWNPASLVGIESNLQVGAQHAEWFAGIGSYDYVGFGKKLDNDGKSFASLSIIRMAIDKIPNTLRLRGPDGSIDYSKIEEFSVADYAFIASYGRKLNEKIKVGANAKVIHRTFGSFAKAWGFGLDASMNYKLSDKLNFALMARDISTTFNAYKFSFTADEKAILQQTSNSIPVSSVEYTLPKFIGGLSYKLDLSSKMGLLSELDLEFSGNGTASSLLATDKFNIDPRIGFEVNYGKNIFLRLGAGNFQRPLKDDNSGSRDFSFYPTAGIGLKMKKIAIDYAMSNVASTGVGLYSHYFSAFLNF